MSGATAGKFDVGSGELSPKRFQATSRPAVGRCVKPVCGHHHDACLPQNTAGRIAAFECYSLHGITFDRLNSVKLRLAGIEGGEVRGDEDFKKNAC